MQGNPEKTDKLTWLDKQVLQSFSVDWERLLYALIFIAALMTRFWDLGARAMSHDESLHSLYSYKLYAGDGYRHDPMMHGPILFELTAFVFTLLGDNDYTARVGIALLGLILVMLPIFFRPWLGKWGALFVSVGLLISPSVMFYSRYIRHDIINQFCTIVMFLSFFQYMRTHGSRWLYIGAIAVGLSITTMEIYYIHGFIGLSFILAMYYWETASNKRLQNSKIIVMTLLLLLVGSIAGLNIMFTPDKQMDSAGKLTAIGQSIHTLILALGIVGGLSLLVLFTDREKKPVAQAIKSLDLGSLLRRRGTPRSAQATALIGGAGAVVVIFVLAYSTFFTNPAGLYTGSFGAISYWLKQQDVQRGTQPWYYYLMLMSMYEFLPFCIGGIGGLYYLLRRRAPFVHSSSTSAALQSQPEWNKQAFYPSDGGTFAGFLVYWCLSALLIYSWAGEKMPWLTVHMAIPFTFLAGHVLQSALKGLDFARLKGWVTPIFVGSLLLFGMAVINIMGIQPFKSQSLSDMEQTSRFIFSIILIIILGGVIGYFGVRMGKGQALRATLLTGVGGLSLLTIRFAIMASFINYDYVSEYLFYAHGTPDIKIVLQQIDDISRRTVGDRQIKVAYDNDSTWPLEWYMRLYPNRAYYGDTPNRQALDAPVVIVGQENEKKVRPFLGNNYEQFKYRLVWWPMESYKGQNLLTIWQTLKNSDSRNKLWQVLFYRKYDTPLSEWPYVHPFYLYIRKDVLNKIWSYQTGPAPVAAEAQQQADPYAAGKKELAADLLIGSQGSENEQLNSPRNVAVGQDGTIYIADSGNSRIQVFDAKGNFLKSWGSNGVEPGQFQEPWGIAVATTGEIYVADTWNHRIQVFDAQGKLLRVWGTYGNTNGQATGGEGNLFGPRDIAFDAKGNLYVTDTGNKRVIKFTPDGKFLGQWGGGGVDPGNFEEPVGIAIDGQGNIYVADTWNRRIQKFDANFKPLSQWPISGWESESVVNKPYLRIDTQRKILYVTDPEFYRVLAFDLNGKFIATFGQYGFDINSFALPIGMAVDKNGALYVADGENHRIVRFSDISPLLNPKAPPAN